MKADFESQGSDLCEHLFYDVLVGSYKVCNLYRTGKKLGSCYHWMLCLISSDDNRLYQPRSGLLQ